MIITYNVYYMTLLRTGAKPSMTKIPNESERSFWKVWLDCVGHTEQTE